MTFNHTEPAWLVHARDDIGVEEKLGPNDSLWIRRMWASLTGSWLLGKPWCGGAVAYWLQRCDIGYPKAYYRARAWLDWGVPVAPVVGCVVVFERKGGGHVGLLVGKDETGRLLVLGGNQGNKVSIAPFDPKRVIGCRWPKEWTYIIPPAEQLPVLASAAASSTNEA